MELLGNNGGDKVIMNKKILMKIAVIILSVFTLTVIATYIIERVQINRKNNLMANATQEGYNVVFVDKKTFYM